MERFTIQKNDFLSHDCTGYFHLYYVGYGQPGNPDYLNTLKNIFVSTHPDTLRAASRQAASLMIQDIPQVMDVEGLDTAILMAVPRSKSGMCNWQLGFKAAVRTTVKALQADNLSVIDGTDCIFRHTSTKMTHLRKPVSNFENTGSEPYPGITKDTCDIQNEYLKGRTVILIDDIYTKTVNVDEDCIQALYDAGAARVIFYAVAYTNRNAYKRGA